MRFFLLIAGFLVSLISHGQEEYFVAEYYMTSDLDALLESKDVLYVNNNQDKSFYQKGKLKYREAYKPSARKENEIVISSITTVDEFNYFNFKEKKLVSRTSPIETAYMVEEDIPIMHWELIDETKKIKEIELHKAICSFRGRNYTAWYSLEYPIHIGPWKFNGLPGLAFEITEDQSHYNWSLISIKKVRLKAFPLRYDLKRGIISLKEYVAKFEYELDHINDAFFAKLPKEIERISTESDVSNFKKYALEKIYEWENQ